MILIPCIFYYLMHIQDHNVAHSISDRVHNTAQADSIVPVADLVSVLVLRQAHSHISPHTSSLYGLP